MKGISFLLILISSLNIFAAADRVGDRIVYTGSYNTQSMKMEMIYESFQDPDMIRRSRTFMDGNLVADETDHLAPSEVISMQSAGLMVALCTQNGGVQEYLNLPVGKTLTCKVNSSNVSTAIFDRYRMAFKIADTIWLGPFPVTGIAQMEVGGNTFSVVNYHWN